MNTEDARLPNTWCSLNTSSSPSKLWHMGSCWSKQAESLFSHSLSCSTLLEQQRWVIMAWGASPSAPQEGLSGRSKSWGHTEVYRFELLEKEVLDHQMTAWHQELPWGLWGFEGLFRFQWGCNQRPCWVSSEWHSTSWTYEAAGIILLPPGLL